MLGVEDIKDILAELKQALQGHYGDRLVKLILYGSHARGEATEDSDVDVLVVLKEMCPGGASREIDATCDMVYELNVKYGVLLTLLPITVEKYENYNSPLLLNVREDGVVV